MPLHLAVQGCDLEAVQLLLEVALRTFLAVDCNTRKPLDYALEVLAWRPIYGSQTAVVRFLIAAGPALGALAFLESSSKQPGSGNAPCCRLHPCHFPLTGVKWALAP